jgi:hypothetical protein
MANLFVFTTVEESEFKRLISGLSKLKSEAKCMCRKTVVMKIRTKYKDTIRNIKEDLERIKYVLLSEKLYLYIG